MKRRHFSSCWNVNVATTFSTPYILALLHHANTRATCSYVMMLRSPLLPFLFCLPSSLNLRWPFVCSHAKATNIVADLVSGESRMHTRAIIWTLCHRVVTTLFLVALFESVAWNPESCNTLSLLKCALPRAREVLSRASWAAIYLQIIRATLVDIIYIPELLPLVFLHNYMY